MDNNRRTSIAVVRIDSNQTEEILNKIITLSPETSKCIIAVRQGEIKVILDEVEYHLLKNGILFMESSQSFSVQFRSDDFKACSILFGDKFIYNPILNLPSVSKNFPILNSSAIIINNKLMHQIYSRILSLEENITRIDHQLQEMILYIDLLGIVLELGNAMATADGSIIMGETVDRKKNIVHRFKCLLVRNCREHHSVSFYAETLAISPEYLTRILKSLTNKNTNEWIDLAIIKEASHFIQNTELSFQQIASELFFSDQASFSKFFKKHTGKNPKQYRQSCQLIN